MTKILLMDRPVCLFIAERSGKFRSHTTYLIVIQIKLRQQMSDKEDGKKEVTVFLGIEVCKPLAYFTYKYDKKAFQLKANRPIGLHCVSVCGRWVPNGRLTSGIIG